VVARFLRNTDGATSIEYCLIAGVISIVIVSAASRIGQQIYAKFYGPLGSAFN
jgi:pilus assembly protein Flp/PilA